jgi:hypothetical protein
VLKKRLSEKGWLASREHKRGTLTIRRTIAGSAKDVLHLRRRSLLPEEPDSHGILDQCQEETTSVMADVGFSCQESISRGHKPDLGGSNEINGMDSNCRKCQVLGEGEGLDKKLSGDRVIEKPDLSTRPIDPKPDDQTPCIERFEL